MTEKEATKRIGCSCIDWQENISYLVDMLMLKWRHGGKGYDGKAFKYCPWCGKEVVELPPEENVPAG